jgi:PAS domain S-box-containing protein
MAQATTTAAYEQALAENAASNTVPKSGVASDVSSRPVSHDVHFYDNDAELCAIVSDFVLDGLHEGAPVVIIATEDHVREVSTRLEELGLDLAQVCATRRLRFLDARQLLQTFMVGSRPDWALFKAKIGGLFERGDGSPLAAHTFAYGEMVDLLWKAGNPSGAVQLEEMWTHLQASLPFSLLCAYAMANFYNSPRGMAEVCRTHGRVHARLVARRESLGAKAGAQRSDVQSRAWVQREQIEGALRTALRDVSANEAAQRDSERTLRSITNALPVLVSFIDFDRRYRFVNQTYAKWFGGTEETMVGKHMAEVLGAAAYAQLSPYIDAALRGENVNVQLSVPYESGQRFVDASYTPQFGTDGKVLGLVALVADVTEQKRHELTREATAERNERLMKVTAAMAAAVDAAQVFEAVVDHVATALQASSAGLWLLETGRERAALVRCVGYSDAARRYIGSVPLDLTGVLPAADAMLAREPIWIGSQAELLRRYPHLASLVSPDRAYGIACLPLMVEGKARGVIAFTFDDARINDRAERDFLLLVARYSGQAVERLRLLENERALRAQAEALHEANEQARARAELLYELAAEVIRSKNLNDVFDAAIAGIERALGASRCSILAFDNDGVMRFRAWRGLSDHYRAAVEGHSPWHRDNPDPQPIVVPDVHADPGLSAYRPLFESEGIGALGFIPLTWQGQLTGKLMVYYPAPRALSAAELDLAKAIANHLAAALGRFAAVRELEETVHFNEIFTGMLGHDLRNPLGAIMAAAQIAERRSEGEQLKRPLSRILSSGGRMAKMIDQLLDFTRVRVGDGIPIDARGVDVVPILKQVMDEVGLAHPDWQIRLEHQGGDTLGVWDADRISQIFSNLVANAVQHGVLEQGVTVRVDGNDPGNVSVQVHNRGTIPPGILPHLFEPMAGGDRRREKSRGLGLGLYISREILKAHGGTIRVETGSDAGTTFAVVLPRTPAPPKPRASGR